VPLFFTVCAISWWCFRVFVLINVSKLCFVIIESATMETALRATKLLSASESGLFGEGMIDE
jgi:hypothetical protein